MKTREQINHDYYIKHKQQHAGYMTQYFKEHRDTWNEYQRSKSKEYRNNKKSINIGDILAQLNNSAVFTD